MKTYLLTKKTLHPTNNGKYNYCPYCLKDFEEKNQNKNITYKETMDPLTYFKFLIVDQNQKGETYKATNEYWECQRCKRKLTEDDYLKSYCLRADGTSYSQPPRRPEDERHSAI